MGRLPRISPQYLSDRDALGLRGSSEIGRDIGRVVRDLANADALPAAADMQGIVPGSREATVQLFAYARRVPGRNLWVWYQDADGEVRIVGLTRYLTER